MSDPLSVRPFPGPPKLDLPFIAALPNGCHRKSPSCDTVVTAEISKRLAQARFLEKAL